MTNKQIVGAALISTAVFAISMSLGGETDVGFNGFAYYAGLLGFYVFNIWGYVRLYKA